MTGGLKGVCTYAERLMVVVVVKGEMVDGEPEMTFNSETVSTEQRDFCARFDQLELDRSALPATSLASSFERLTGCD